ncbi:MAG: hypothetical protein DI539_25090 [Flavobacterium psychrophilum]|nr:MAG: hypothetical protein DI539_25090 [Flavobacterium psychrophilum]
MPGDKIDMQVFGKYYDPNTPHTTDAAWSTLLGFIELVREAAQTVVVDGVGYTSGILRVPPYAGVLTDPNESAAYPKAHLNWATFDRDWRFLDGGAKQLQGGAEDGTDVPFAEISKSIEIKEPGYVYIWLSNTSDQQRDVFFDDFKVVHTESPIVQQNDYYPYGLVSNSNGRENLVVQSYKFNGNEEQDELQISLMDFNARFYDPSFGRFINIDPMSENIPDWTPYRFGLDNPVNFSDPLGLIEQQIQDFDGNSWSVDCVNGECDKAKKVTNSEGGAGQGGCPPGHRCETDKNGHTSVYGDDGNVMRVIPAQSSQDQINEAIGDIGNLLTEGGQEMIAGTVLAFIGDYAVVKIFQGGKWAYTILKANQINKALSSASVTDKLTRYILNFDHAVGKEKARWFKGALGYTLENMDDLAKQIVFNSKKAVQTEITQHGVKFNQVISIKGANGKTIDVTFGWIKNNSDGVVRLVTAIPE